MCMHLFMFFNDTATTEIYTLSLHDALPICTTSRAEYLLNEIQHHKRGALIVLATVILAVGAIGNGVYRLVSRRSEEHTSELQSRQYLVCRLLLEKKTRTSLSH